jgi:hypothetical protein
MATSAVANYASQNNVDYLANINKWIDANRNATQAQVDQQMSQYGISEADIVKALAQRTDLSPGSTLKLGDTYFQPNFKITGSGENQEVGPIENFLTYTSAENKVGGKYNQYTPTGELERVGTQQKVDSGLKDFALGSALLFGGLGGGLQSLLGGGTGTAASTLGAETAGGLLTPAANTVGTTGLTASELALRDMALGGAGGTAGAETLASALTTGATVPTLTNLTGGSGLLTGAEAGITAQSVADKLGADAFETMNAGASAITPTELPPNTPTVTPATVPTTTPSVTPSVTPTVPAVTPTTTATSGLLSNLPSSVTNALTTAGTGLLSGLTGQQTSNIPGLISNLLSGTGGLLQQQTSKEAAQAAQQRIDAETEAAKQASQFRPIGTTTRFGSSQFTYDPVTGQMISAGYQLSPEAKAQQDRLMALSNQGLTQAEQAQAQFAPLQTGAQSLFNLGNKYLAQTPEEVAQKYIAQQMNLLQPGRELELANLQNKLQQQGRAGLAVAQGGNYGATTPELQALFNARAMQEAQLAANAQQAGQQQVAFGAGLLGQGANTMGQYYAGQQAAYAPYTTALGQVQNLEAQGQQGYNMSNALAQQLSQAGARAGQLGLTGAQLSTKLATSEEATTNPYATALSGLGSSTSLLGQGLGKWAQGLFGSNAGTGVAGNPYAVGEYANPEYWT